MLKRKRPAISDVIWLLSFGIALTIILLLCKYGFASTDESFYLAVPYRLMQGDALIKEEWNIAHLSSLLIYPLLKLYSLIAGTTEGILLSFRYIYTLLHAAVAVFIFLSLRKTNWGAVFASLIYLVFTPFGIKALSYNSMGIAMTAISCIILYNYKNEGKNYYSLIISGACFAVAVLCCPYLIIPFLIFCFAYIISLLIKKMGIPVKKNILLRDVLAFTVGAGVVAVFICIFIFSRCSLSDVIKSVPHILDDPSHPPKNSFWEIIFYYLQNIVHSSRYGKPIFICCTILFAVIIFDKNKSKRYLLYFSFALILTVAYLASLMLEDIKINFLMFALNILGFFCFCCMPKDNIREFVFLWLPGMIYGFFLNISSNNGFYAISEAALISSLGSILIIVSFLQNLSKEQLPKPTIIICKAVIVCLFTAFLTIETITRCTVFYRDETINEMKYVVACGSQKGIHTTESKKEEYEALFEDTNSVRYSDAESVLYYVYAPWLYLDDEKNNSGPSTWFKLEFDSDASINKTLIDYYNINPKKIPDIVYTLKDDWLDAENFLRYFDGIGEYKLSETKQGYVLTKVQ